MQVSENVCISENADFGFLAAEALEAEDEVDFENGIILHKTVLNNQKVKCVYDKLINLSSTIFNDIINNYFASSKNSHVRIKITTTPNGEDAFTRGFTDGVNSFFEIQLDPTFVNNASTIEIALVLIHESIHAELLERCIRLGIINTFSISGNPNFTNTSITFSTYDALFAILVYEYKNFGGSNSEWNHDMFSIGNYRTKMVQNLISVHPWLNDSDDDFLTNVNVDPLNFYGGFNLEELMEYASWIGLEQTQEFINTVQNNPLEHTKKNYVENATKAQYTNECN